MSRSMIVNSKLGFRKKLVARRLLLMFLIKCTLSNIRYVY